MYLGLFWGPPIYGIPSKGICDHGGSQRSLERPRATTLGRRAVQSRGQNEITLLDPVYIPLYLTISYYIILCYIMLCVVVLRYTPCKGIV